jgi:hypothetical protein
MAIINNTTMLSPGAELRGWIKFFNAAKGFGFASVHQPDNTFADVFIRKEKGKLVTGTYNEPDFTDKPFDYSEYRFRRDSTGVIMVVEPDGRGGWRARSWGALPEYTWIDLYLDYPDIHLDKFVGGRVELYHSSPFGTGGYTARIDGLELTREYLTVRARHYPIGCSDLRREPRDSELRHAFEAVYALADVVSHDDRYRLELRLVEDDSRSRLVFTEPSR